MTVLVYVLDIRWCAAVADSVIKAIVRAVPWPSGSRAPRPLPPPPPDPSGRYTATITRFMHSARATRSLSLCYSPPPMITTRARDSRRATTRFYTFLVPSASTSLTIGRHLNSDIYSPRRVYSHWIISVHGYCNPHVHIHIHSFIHERSRHFSPDSLICNNNIVDTRLIINRAAIIRQLSTVAECPFLRFD